MLGDLLVLMMQSMALHVVFVDVVKSAVAAAAADAVSVAAAAVNATYNTSRVNGKGSLVLTGATPNFTFNTPTSSTSTPL